MGYQSTVQVIRRRGKNRQYYLICPTPLAQAMEIEKGEVIEWLVEDKHTLILKRTPERPSQSRKASQVPATTNGPARDVPGSARSYRSNSSRRIDWSVLASRYFTMTGV